ncbi:hypothetical protein J6590_108403 [Homalodisca vitripennis]|nr:hypothetical protein J6590_108403 [Homalodisca vitripennis]
MVDDFTKYNWIVPLKKVNSGMVLQALESNIFKNFGLPEVIVSDNATYFTSEELRTNLFKWGVKLITTIPYNPQGNKSERYLRNLNSILTCLYSDCKRNWDSDLSKIQQAVNSCVNDSTEYSAYYFMFNFKPNNELDLKWNLKSIF